MSSTTISPIWHDLPIDLVRRVMKYTPIHSMNRLQKRLTSVRRLIGRIHAYGNGDTLFDRSTEVGCRQHNRMTRRFIKLIVRGWGYTGGDDHYCFKCLKHHADKSTMVFCPKCKHGYCMYQQRVGVLNYNYGIHSITKGILVKNRIYQCNYCTYHKNGGWAGLTCKPTVSFKVRGT